jgi:hypothetical protein
VAVLLHSVLKIKKNFLPSPDLKNLSNFLLFQEKVPALGGRIR